MLKLANVELNVCDSKCAKLPPRAATEDLGSEFLATILFSCVFIDILFKLKGCAWPVASVHSVLVSGIYLKIRTVAL